MSSSNRSPEEIADRLETVREAYERLQSWRAVARELDWPRRTVRFYQNKLGAAPRPVAGGSIYATAAKKMPLPPKGEVRRYILTCAQNNTYHHEQAWANLIALAEHLDAEILISRFAYNTQAFGQAKNEKPGTHRRLKERDDLWYDPELAECFWDERVELAPGLVFCGESNISPTAVRPLSGLEAYTGRSSAIFPHVKITMESVASGKFEGVKLLYTTGTVTKRNYIQRKAGLKAEFHHTYGGLLVEVDSSGRWYCRQLNAAASDGTIYDLDLCAKDGEVTAGHRVEAITFGDVHAAQVDPGVAQLGWGAGGMIDVLKPREVHLHDLLDFRARNHHDRANPHLQFAKFVEGEDSVEEEVRECVGLVAQINCKVVVVQSNHDNALLRWLREADYRHDPANALFFLTCQKRVYESIANGEQGFHLLEWVMQQMGAPRDIRFLRMDESYILCKDRSGGIECGMHGHAGPNGARGNPWSFVKMGRRSNVGHTHSAGIIDGVYVAGTSSKLDCGYNVGPSSWTHSHIVTYPNGKRTIITMYGGGWRAE